jgi:hypothetical protein
MTDENTEKDFEDMTQTEILDLIIELAQAAKSARLETVQDDSLDSSIAIEALYVVPKLFLNQFVHGKYEGQAEESA